MTCVVIVVSTVLLNYLVHAMFTSDEIKKRLTGTMKIQVQLYRYELKYNNMFKEHQYPMSH